jgi:drug/metabolite transporter (DMT)-like permease
LLPLLIAGAAYFIVDERVTPRQLIGFVIAFYRGPVAVVWQRS